MRSYGPVRGAISNGRPYRVKVDSVHSNIVASQPTECYFFEWLVIPNKPKTIICF